MLIFGHTGITVGIVRACDILINRPLNNNQPDSSSRLRLAVSKKWLPIYHRLNRIGRQLGSIDYRMVLLGSLLPDIIDKIPWLFASSDIFPSGRDYGHTFLFNLLLFICGLILLKYKKSWLLIISSSSVIHLILDRMWNNPVALWWPLLGPFHPIGTTGWLSNILHALFSDPGTYIPEIIGLLIILVITYKLIVRKGVLNFIRTGAIETRAGHFDSELTTH
jgi:inner membrane protein